MARSSIEEKDANEDCIKIAENKTTG